MRAERGRARAHSTALLCWRSPPDAGPPILAVFKLILNLSHVNSRGVVDLIWVRKSNSSAPIALAPMLPVGVGCHVAPRWRCPISGPFHSPGRWLSQQLGRRRRRLSPRQLLHPWTTELPFLFPVKWCEQKKKRKIVKSKNLEECFFFFVEV